MVLSYLVSLSFLSSFTMITTHSLKRLKTCKEKINLQMQDADLEALRAQRMAELKSGAVKDGPGGMANSAEDQQRQT
jgi:hypothetical protein